MTKTAKQIQGDVRRLLLNSTIAQAISGGVYRAGLRPRDSRQEDAIITFTTGLPGQIHSGVVTVNIYVPDIDPDANGTWVENAARTAQLESLAAQWVNSLNGPDSDYHFTLRQTIYTEPEPEIRQHFVVVRLGYSALDY